MLEGEDMNVIVLATKNKDKLKEFKSLFPEYNFLSLQEFAPEEEIVENGSSFIENATIKAKTIALKYHVTALADDSGLEVEALNGAPGIYSARYAVAHNDQANNALLIQHLKGVKNRKARYVCAICLYHSDGQSLTVLETCDGVILEEPRGHNGFGYDPYFYMEDYQKTFAEMSLEEKNKVSHRSKALRKLKELCHENFSFE